MTPSPSLRQMAARLRRSTRGVAMVEFALCLPFVVLTTMTAAELTNYTTTKMRVSQLALQIADNASRVGAGTVQSTRTVSELQLNDLLTGANIQSGRLNLFGNGRVIISSLQPGAAANTYVVKWQRCKGAKSFTSAYPAAGTTERSTTSATANLFKVTPPPGGAVIFVEINYTYQPLIGNNFLPLTGSRDIKEIAAMTVRDNRDYTGGTNGIYNSENAPIARCNLFSAT